MRSEGAAALRRAAIGLLLMTLLPVGAGCSSSGHAVSATRPAGASGSDGDGYRQVAATSAAEAVRSGGEVARQLLRSARLGISVRDVPAASRQAAEIVKQASGYVSDSSGDTGRLAILTARVPAEAFDPVLQGFAGLGREYERQLSAEDVTDQLVDLDTRIANQRVLRDRLRALFERGGSIEELLKVETELARVQTELERLEAQVDGLRRRVAYSSIVLTLREDEWPGPGGVVLRALGDTIGWFFRYPQRAVLPWP
jgi:hypothetical protein